LNSQQLAALLGFLFVAAWAALGLGDAVLCLLGAAVFGAAAAFYSGELDLTGLQQRASASRSARAPR
jgi:hypothetical protein